MAFLGIDSATHHIENFKSCSIQFFWGFYENIILKVNYFICSIKIKHESMWRFTLRSVTSLIRLKLLCTVVSKDISGTVALLVLYIVFPNTPQGNHFFRGIPTIKIIKEKK